MVGRQVATGDANNKNHSEKRSKLTGGRACRRAAVRLMAMRLFICVLVGVLLAYIVRARSSHYAVNPSPRLFHPMAAVREFRSGDVQTMKRMIARSELSMVMFYAPWCAESKLAAREFVEAAKVLHKEIFFAAINCWEYGGECRKKFPFPRFPKFFVYNSRLEGIEYRGPVTAQHIVRFLRRVASPVRYIRDLQDLIFFCALEDTGVLGYFDFPAWRPTLGYWHFYLAAQNALEKDPFHGVEFGVMTNPEVAGLVKINQTQTVVMIRALNDTLMYPGDRNFTHSDILEWVQEHRMQTVQWLPLAGVKSLQLSTELKAGPALLYFTPDDLQDSVDSPAVAMFREVALDYYNCNNSGKVNDFIHISRQNRLIMPDKQSTENRKADKKLPKSVNDDNHSIEKYLQTQGIDLDVDGDIHSTKHCDSTCNEELQRDCSNKCENTKTNDNVALNEQTSQTDCDTVPAYSDFLYSKEANLKHSVNDNTVQSASDEGVDVEGRDVNITGLGCRTNRSVGFYLLDANSHWSFAENIGVKPRSGETESVVIVDVNSEVQFVMDPSLQINETNIAAFIHNFTVSQLQRHLSAAPPPDRTCLPNSTQPCVVELTAETFHEVVLDETKDVLLLYYAPWCGVCSALAHVWMVLASFFKRASNLVLARINGEKNDLPWEFTVPSYPTILFFPAYRKDRSVRYPDDLPMTLPNLAKFVLAHIRRRNSPRSNPNSHKVMAHCEENTNRNQFQIQSLERELSSMKEEIESLRTQAQKLQGALRIVKGANSRLHAENKEKDLRIEALKKSEAKLKQALKEKEVRLLQADVFMRALQEGSVQAASENVLLKMQVSALQQALDAVYNVMEEDKKQAPTERKDKKPTERQDPRHSVERQDLRHSVLRKDPRHAVDAAQPFSSDGRDRKDRTGNSKETMTAQKGILQKDLLKDSSVHRKVAHPVRDGGRKQEESQSHSMDAQVHNKDVQGHRKEFNGRDDTGSGKQRVAVVPTAKIQHTQVLHTHENNPEDYN